jgi:hypothetical protein
MRVLSSMRAQGNARADASVGARDERSEAGARFSIWGGRGPARRRAARSSGRDPETTSRKCGHGWSNSRTSRPPGRVHRARPIRTGAGRGGRSCKQCVSDTVSFARISASPLRRGAGRSGRPGPLSSPARSTARLVFHRCARNEWPPLSLRWGSRRAPGGGCPILRIRGSRRPKAGGQESSPTPETTAAAKMAAPPPDPEKRVPASGRDLHAGPHRSAHDRAAVGRRR